MTLHKMTDEERQEFHALNHRIFNSDAAEKMLALGHRIAQRQAAEGPRPAPSKSRDDRTELSRDELDSISGAMKGD